MLTSRGAIPFPTGWGKSPSCRSPAVRQAGFLGLQEPLSQVSTAHPASGVQMDTWMDRQTPGAAGVCLISVSETLIFLWKTLFPKGAAGGGALPTETAARGFLAL